MMDKVTWKEYPTEMPANRGRYMTAFFDPDDGTMLLDTCWFFKRGDIIYSKESPYEGTAEQKLLDSILAPELQVLADNDGFYCIADEMDDAWEVRPLYWADPPAAPEGFKWGEETFAQK